MHFSVPLARHNARSRRALIVVVSVGLFAAICGIAIGTAANGSSGAHGAGNEMGANQHPPRPTTATSIPVPELAATVATSSLCKLPTVTDAIARGDASAAIAESGGVEQFRRAIALGTSPCVLPSDPNQIWFVVNKARSFPDTTWAPTDIVVPATYSQIGSGLRAEAAIAFDRLADASLAEGAGAIALNSGYRSFETQETSYASQVDASGQDEADHTSARPGHSEHQTGLTADVVACAATCGTLDDLASTKQGEWIAQNSWRFGWIVRYEEGYTPITGYTAEPWHLRYIGVELAGAYRAGGYHTLEEFFGLPAAANYIG